MKLLTFTAALCIGLLSQANLYAQKIDTGHIRPNWSVDYRFGIADGPTRNYFNTIQSIGAKKSFNVSKLVTLNLLTEFSFAKGKTGNDLNAFSLGGGFALYPRYLVSLIRGRSYEAKKDYTYVDFGIQAIINKTDVDYIYSMEYNVYTHKFKNNQSLSPKIGYNIFMSNQEVSSNPTYKDLSYTWLTFYSIGLSYNF
jgi:hypothetical protein